LLGYPARAELQENYFLHEQGEELRSAVQKAIRIRLRPIINNSLTFIYKNI
jgi:multidrug efflux pump subunit AcrB